MTKIKICGITRVEDALLAESLGADYIGLIFTQHSKRRITIEQAKDITNALTSAKPIGLFIEQDRLETFKIAEHINLYGIQHYQYFNEGFAPYFYIYAQAVSENVPRVTDYPAADALLIDHKSANAYGGTGQSFDWTILPQDQMDKIIIAGGIGSDNVRAALRYQPFAIDLSSRVETAPGIKDKQLLTRLFQEIHNEKQS